MRLDALRAQKVWVSWSTLAPFLNDRTLQFSTFLPLIGYLVLFNDQIAEYLQFATVSGKTSTLFLSGKSRLQFLYFGFIFASISVIALHLSYPKEIKGHANATDYSAFWLTHITARRFHEIYCRLEKDYGFGKFGDVPYDRTDLYEFFDKSMPGKIASTEMLSDEELWFDLTKTGNVAEAKNQSRDFLIFTLEANFLYLDRSKRTAALSIGFALFFSAFLILVPSIDLFATITFDLVSTFTTTQEQAVGWVSNPPDSVQR